MYIARSLEGPYIGIVSRKYDGMSRASPTAWHAGCGSSVPSSEALTVCFSEIYCDPSRVARISRSCLVTTIE